MSKNEINRDFFGDIDRSFTEPTYPGMVERLEILFEREIGRGIVVERSIPNSSYRTEEVKAGYILPLDIAQTQHIVVLRNGEIFKTTYDGEEHIKRYVHMFKPKPAHHKLSRYVEIDMISDHLDGNDWFRSRVMMQGNNKENVDQLAEDLTIALLTAIEMKRNGSRIVESEGDKHKTYRGDKVVRRLEDIAVLDYEIEFVLLEQEGYDLERDKEAIEIDDIPYGSEE